MRKLRIYGFGTQQNGCSKFRVWQPLAMLERMGLAEVRREPDAPRPISADRANEIFSWADVVLLQPFSELWAAGLMIGGRNVHKKKLVVDLDDNVFAVHPLNLGTQDGKLFYLTNRFSAGFDEYWEITDVPEGEVEKYASRMDGTVFESEQGLKFLRNKSPDGKLVASAMMQHADAVTTTNEHLAGVFRKVTKSPVFSLPNCLDFSEWDAVERPKKQGTWLGWCGSVSHYPDLKPLTGVFDGVMERHPEVKFHVMGSSFDYLFPPKPGVEFNQVSGYAGGDESNEMWHVRLEDCGERWPGRMDFHRPVMIQQYIPWFKGNFKADIGLAPIADTEFNLAKSELKWLEYSALKIPTIASKVGPYARTIRHGEDGLLCGGNGAWKKALEELLGSPERRQEIAEAAHERVRTEYDAEKRAIDWLKVYEGL